MLKLFNGILQVMKCPELSRLLNGREILLIQPYYFTLCSCGELEIIRIKIHQSFNEIYLLQSYLHSVLMLRATRSVGSPELGSDHPGPHPVEVRVGPFGGGPGAGELDVCAEIDLVQFVMDELSDVPGKIIMSGKMIY